MATRKQSDAIDKHNAARMKPKARAVITSARNLSTFKASHDPETIIPNKIRTALEDLRTKYGDEAYAYEQANPPGDDSAIQPFTKLSDVSPQILSRYRSQFADHVVEAKADGGSRTRSRTVWFATVKAAKAARAE